MMLFNRIDTFIAQYNLTPPHSTIVLGLSGGPDSVFLLNFLAQKHHKKDISLIAAHLDHQWRSETFKDVTFCRTITEQLHIPFVTTTMAALPVSIKRNGSQEETGRKARRYFLEQVLHENNANLIALAHHAQDQQETFFIRLIRGTSLTGLTSMWPKQGFYIRPLLEINKDEIVTYLKKNNISYLEDPSNESPLFLRNRIRATVLPALRACDSRFDANFLATLHRLQETELFLEQLTIDTFNHLVLADNSISIKALLEQPLIMQYRLLVHWLTIAGVQFPISQSFFDEIVRFFGLPGSKEHQVNPSWKLAKKGNTAEIVRSSHNPTLN